MILYPNRNFGIVADSLGRRVSIFDTDTLQVLQHIPLDADVMDVAITKDGSRAVVSSFDSKTIFQLNLCGKSAIVVGSAKAQTYLEDVALTPDDRFAVCVDGSLYQDIVCYSLKENTFVSNLSAYAQAAAVSPMGNGLVLTAKEYYNSVHRYTVNRSGIISDTGQEFAAGLRPRNINFSSDGAFAFISGYISGGVSVLSTILLDKIGLISTDETVKAQSMAITRDDRHLFVLGPELVSIFTFDSVTGYLSLARSFQHGLNISGYYGVDQIALDPSETRLFISGRGEVAVFTTYGIKLGTVADAFGPGGLAICPGVQRCLDRSSLLGLLLLIALL